MNKLITNAGLWLLLVGCGVDANTMTVQPGPVSTCDSYGFRVATLRDATIVEELDCYNFVPSCGIDPNGNSFDCFNDRQGFTKYSTKTASLTLWANSSPVRVDGDAPPCVKTEYAESVPRSPLTIDKCHVKRLR